MTNRPEFIPAEPPPVPDPESDWPLREPVARRLPASTRRELETAVRDAYFAAMEDCTSPETAESDIRATLRAAALDLDRTAALLDYIAGQHLQSTMPRADVLVSVLAAPRAVEARAVADRICRMLAHEPTPGRPFPAGLDAAGMEPAP